MQFKRRRKRLPLSLVTPVLTAGAATQSQATPPNDPDNTSGHRGLSIRLLPRAESTSPDAAGRNHAPGGSRLRIDYLAPTRRFYLGHTSLLAEHRVNSGPSAAPPIIKSLIRRLFIPGSLQLHVRPIQGPRRPIVRYHPMCSLMRAAILFAAVSTSHAAGTRPPIDLPPDWSVLWNGTSFRYT